MPAVSFKTFVQGSTAASTPLGGTEQIVIIQGNAVVRCVADDLGGGGGGGATVVSKTVAEMQALALASGFTVGQLYKITDAGDLGLFFRAATTSKLENDGIRAMLCPAYYGTGEHNGDGNNWLGVWNADLTPAADDLAIWGGLVWRNLTGAVGSSDSDIALDGTNWVVVTKASFAASEYTPMIFGCSYDLTNNWICKQWDAAGNVFGVDFYTEDNWWELGFNPCDVSDWNLATKGQNFFNNVCIGVWNNSNEGSIIGNRLRDGAISNNSNNGDIYVNANTGDINGNSINGNINYNSNAGIIYSNGASVTGITNNVNAGNINNNSNAGEISLNTHSGYISGCSNGDSISGCYGNGNLDNISIPAPISGELPKNIYQRNSDFTANGISGATYTDTGSSGQVNVAFFDAPIGHEYSFFVTDNAIQLEPHTIGHTIQFWDGNNSRNTGWVLLGAPGKSITIKKISATVWAGIAVNGATDND